jgi:hypothetical protein
MHFYQLEDKAMDQDFLGGKPVRCRAVLRGTNEHVAAGDFILVVLSNGKKYKGRVIAFESFQVENYIAGELVISRVS